jgi:hypothetical protein
MNIPPPTLIRGFLPDLDQAFDEPFHCPFHCFSHEVELLGHVQEVIGQDSHKQPALVGGRAVATGFVPAQKVLPLFDSVLSIAVAVVHLDHFPGRARNQHGKRPVGAVIVASEDKETENAEKELERFQPSLRRRRACVKSIRGNPRIYQRFHVRSQTGAYTCSGLPSWLFSGSPGDDLDHIGTAMAARRGLKVVRVLLFGAPRKRRTGISEGGQPT